MFFGAVESSPFLSNLATPNMLSFTITKLGVAILVGLLFYQGDKILNLAENPNAKTTRIARLILKSAYAASLFFLFFAVLNNLWVIAAKSV